MMSGSGQTANVCSWRNRHLPFGGRHVRFRERAKIALSDRHGAEQTPTRQSTWVSFPLSHPPAPSEAAPSNGRMRQNQSFAAPGL
jgi:hypothetical protein